MSFVCGCVLVACGGDKTRAPTSTPPFTPGVDDAGIVAPSDASSSEASADPAGELVLVHEADTPCSPRGGIKAVVYPPSSAPLGFARLSKVGSRRVADSEYQSGFVLFDSDGANPSPAALRLGEVSRIAASHSDVGVVALSGPTDVIYGRFDFAGVPSGETVTLASDHPYDVAIGRLGGSALAVWSTARDVKARGIDASGALAGPAFSLESASAKDSFAASIIDSGTGNFAVYWSDRRLADGLFGSYIAFTSTTAVSGLAHKVFRTTPFHMVIGLVKTAAGFAALLQYQIPPSTVIVPLDAAGRLAGPGHLLDGADEPLAIASHAGELGVLAVRKDRSIGFRPLDANGAPVGSWVCVDAPSPDIDPSGAIDADGTGWAVLYSDPTGGESFVRFDHLGTGAP